MPMTKVGSKGRITIERDLRDRLGVRQGWFAIQRIVGDRTIEVYFVPPEHHWSLKGVLARYVDRPLPDTEEAWNRAREAAWADAVREKYGDPSKEAKE